MATSDQRLLITTQPGWVFTTVAELRDRGHNHHFPFFHRDSSLLSPYESTLVRDPLLTPAEVIGAILITQSSRRKDSTELLLKQLSATKIKSKTLDLIAQASGGRSRRYSIVVEAHGRTSHRRAEIVSVITDTVAQAFPNWRRDPQGLRFVCKTDPEMTAFGVQLNSKLGENTTRPGSLRSHLAASILTLARVKESDYVFDPFMGTGTILEVARNEFGAYVSGLEVDKSAFSVASSRLGPEPNFKNESFTVTQVDSIRTGTKLVSNLPFGKQFPEVRIDHLLAFLTTCRDAGISMTLLMSRDQAQIVSDAFHLKRKNVLVLGQPASLIYDNLLKS